MSKVLSLRKCEKYEKKIVKESVSQLLNDIGGAEKYFKRTEKILLKPNFLVADPQKKGIITHPFVIKAVAEIAIDHGCKVTIGDSPGLGRVGTILGKSGFGEIFKDLDVKVIDFEKSVEVKNFKDRRFRKFLVEKEVLDSDAVINIPKLKSHGQMLMTLAVKNMFGCIVGKMKPQWHLNAGRKHIDFATMLVELHYLLKPRLNIIDGIYGMHGNGPSAGEPVHVGLLGACEDADALDRIICKVLNLDPDKIYTLKAAELIGLGINVENIELKGDSLDSFRIEKFKLPRLNPMETLGVANYMAGFLKNALTDKPKINEEKCVLCSDCVKQCPSRVMEISQKKNRAFIEINYRKCIRCYCCQEICPEHAIGIKQGWLLSLIRKFRS